MYQGCQRIKTCGSMIRSLVFSPDQPTMFRLNCSILNRLRLVAGHPDLCGYYNEYPFNIILEVKLPLVRSNHASSIALLGGPTYLGPGGRLRYTSRFQVSLVIFNSNGLERSYSGPCHFLQCHWSK